MHESDGHVTWTVGLFGRDLGIPNTITKYGTFEPRIQLRTSCLPFVFTNCGPTTMMAKTTPKTMQSAPSLILLYITNQCDNDEDKHEAMVMATMRTRMRQRAPGPGEAPTGRE